MPYIPVLSVVKVDGVLRADIIPHSSKIYRDVRCRLSRLNHPRVKKRKSERGLTKSKILNGK